MGDSRIKAGITIGDPNGIGCEVIIKALADSRMTELFVPVLYASPKIVAHYKKCIHGLENFQYTQISNPAEARGKRVNLINCLPEELKIEPGTATPEAGMAALQSLKTACEDMKSGLLDVLITGPINKETIQCEEFSFPGHTEYLASFFGGDPLMLMVSGDMRVGLVTTHLPLTEVSRAVSRERILSRIDRLRDSLKRDFGVVEPRIAVLSLNPHAGDGGLLGSEEKDIITPAIEEAFSKGSLAFGPFPSDGFFAGGGYRTFDAVLAMYHDQGLTPFKALAPQGVNFTAGLPIVRTSPDHGVAFDIAGHDVADPSSMREAIYAAIDIFRHRRVYAEMSRNPLKHYERERGHDMSVKDLPQENEEQ